MNAEEFFIFLSSSARSSVILNDLAFINVLHWCDAIYEKTTIITKFTVMAKVIYISGEIGDEDGYTYDKLLSQLDGVPWGSEVTAIINSIGGSVFEGWAIRETLRLYNTTTVVCGIAASIASTIYLGGKKRLMTPNSKLMIHLPGGGVQGNVEDIRRYLTFLEGIAGELLEDFLRNSVLSEDALLELMRAETWIPTLEAIEYGFCDGVFELEFQAKLKINNNMSDILKKAMALLKQQPKSLLLQLSSGSGVYVFTEDGNLVGKRVVLANEDGNPTETEAPAGEHTLADGRIIVVSGGIITEIKEPADDKYKEMESALAMVVAKLEEQQTTITNLTTQLAQATAKAAQLEKAALQGAPRAAQKPGEKPLNKADNAVALSKYVEDLKKKYK